MNHGMTDDPRWLDGVVLRRVARKRYRCWGNGARRVSHMTSCPGWIEIGQPYAEYVAETPSYQSGSRHTMPCAEAFLTKFIVTQ